ncbi:MAG: PCRF domain-containing protein, partial [Proteobacteria bacterium]|nr:PCRF domain-containing protein [Pseudomonadota bacterium]
MKPSIRDKLEQLTGRLIELDHLLGEPDLARDMDNYRKLTREHAEIGAVVALYADYRKAEEELIGAQEMLADAEMKAMAEEEIARCRAAMVKVAEDLQKALLPRDPNDERNLLLEIRAGTGGDESAIFAGDLFRMYCRFAERQRWQVEVI